MSRGSGPGVGDRRGRPGGRGRGRRSAAASRSARSRFAGRRSPRRGAGPSHASRSATATHAAAARVPDVAWLAERGDGRVAPRTRRDDRARMCCRPARPASPIGRAVPRLDPARAPAAARRSGSATSGSAASRGDVDVPIWVSAGAWTSAGLVVTGYGDAVDDDRTAGCSSSASRTSRSGRSWRRDAFPAALGTPVARGEVVVEPVGRVVASNACGVRLCDTQVVDLATADVFRPIQSAEGFLRVVTDDADRDDRRRLRLDLGPAVPRRSGSLAPDETACCSIRSRPRTGRSSVSSDRAAAGWGVAAFDARGRRPRPDAANRDRPSLAADLATGLDADDGGRRAGGVRGRRPDPTRRGGHASCRSRRRPPPDRRRRATPSLGRRR